MRAGADRRDLEPDALGQDSASHLWSFCWRSLDVAVGLGRFLGASYLVFSLRRRCGGSFRWS